jgi:hypothetical protein
MAHCRKEVQQDAVAWADCLVEEQKILYFPFFPVG